MSAPIARPPRDPARIAVALRRHGGAAVADRYNDQRMTRRIAEERGLEPPRPVGGEG